MKEPRTFQIVLLSVFGLLALLGLLLFANSGGIRGVGQAIGTVTIWGTLPKEAVEAGIQELTAVHNEYSDVVYEEKSEATWRIELADALAAGDGPDLIIFSQEELLSQKDKIRPIPFSTITERAYVDTYVPLFELFLSPEGPYGIPLVVDPLVLYYNRTMLSSANIATPPKTWEAVIGIAPSLSKRGDASAITKSAIPFGEYANVTNARAILSLLFLQSGNPITEENEQGFRSMLTDRTLESTTGISAAESAVSYFAQYGDPAKTVYSWNRSLPASREMFLSGDLALYPGYASELPFLEEANPNLDFDMALVPQRAASASRTTYGKGYVLAIPKVTANVYGAENTARMLSEPGPMNVIAEMLSVAPARRSLLTPRENDRFTSVFYPEALSAKGWLSPSSASVDTIFSVMIGNISSGRLEAASALQAAGNALNTELR